MAETTAIALSPDIQTGIDRLEMLRQVIEVKTPEQREEVLDTIRDAKAYKAAVLKFFEGMKKKTYDAWKEVCEKEKFFTNKCDRFEAIAKEKVGAYEDAVENKRLAEQRRLQAEADEMARKERERLEKEAAKLKTPELKAARLEAAAAVEAPVVEVAATIPKVEGVSKRKIWRWKAVNLSLIPREYLAPNERLLDNLARGAKDALIIPGIEFYAETTLSVRKQ